MLKTSIITKITTLFFSAIAGIGTSAYFFISEQEQKTLADEQLKYSQFLISINQLVRGGSDFYSIEKYVNELKLERVKDPIILEKFERELDFRENDGVFAKIIREESGFYLLLQSPYSWAVFEEKGQSSRSLYFVALLFLAFVIVLYALVVRSLQPLYFLRKEVRKFANGNLKANFSLDQKDEVGELAREFGNAVKKINALNSSRHLFLRSIMHELKTPITKGRITAEMVENEQQKQWLIGAFMRLDNLINEFAKIEAFSAQTYQIKPQNIVLGELFTRAFSMLLLEEKQISQNFILPSESVLKMEIFADFEASAMGLKNLLDNALKYRAFGKVRIFKEEQDLCIENAGSPLACELEIMSKPFFKNEKTSQKGLGLGLYIIVNSFERQGFALKYKHEKGQNIFTICGILKEK